MEGPLAIGLWPLTYTQTDFIDVQLMSFHKIFFELLVHQMDTPPEVGMRWYGMHLPRTLKLNSSQIFKGIV